MKNRCQFDGCEEIDTPIIVSSTESLEHAQFCCAEHAARYLLRDASLSTLDRVMEDFGATPA